MNNHPFALDTYELKKLIGVLYLLERECKGSIGGDLVSGGFAVANMFNYDEKIIDIEVKFGVSNDCGRDVYTEQYKINRETMQVMN